MEPNTGPEAELLKVIRAVDSEFAEVKSVPLVRLMWVGLIIVAVAGFGFLGFGYYFSTIAAEASRAGLIDLGVALLGLATSIMALGITALAIIIAADLEPKMRRLKEHYHYDNLKKCGMDPIVLRAVILMKVNLPKDITLEQAHERNRALFTNENFVLRLLGD